MCHYNGTNRHIIRTIYHLNISYKRGRKDKERGKREEECHNEGKEKEKTKRADRGTKVQGKSGKYIRKGEDIGGSGDSTKYRGRYK